ncbi:PKD domain-containing protein [Nocardioides sp. cx-169]|uniref:PKD domain-containing protein n=1 Tax=Nocardioides sp. cx-169 TaxID=2899080 RepID=UPI0027E0B456|nr:PKD domain-containing protein [Nocardioides sp. cx-169]
MLGQGNTLGEAMELTVAPDGRVLFITRAGDIQMYDPADGSIEIIMLNTELGVWSGLEDGGLGITLDPDFATNNHLYVYYAPLPESHNANRLSRLTLTEDAATGTASIAKSSEKVILEVGTQRNICCHSAGSLQFDGNVLHLATGDNTSSSDNGGFSPHDERPGRNDYDAQDSSANTNDLRGKILRVIPRADDAGDENPPESSAGMSYDIPDGNMFGEGGKYAGAKYPAAEAGKTRPEIFVMGLRNPYRLGTDPDSDAIYWGEVGPDSRTNDPNRGPRHQEEFNRTTEAMNGGWPYCGGEVGDDLTDQRFGGAYVDWDFTADRYRTNADGSPKRFPCNDPSGMKGVNDSPNNTGLADLPPMTDAWIPYSTSAPFKYPQVEGSTPTGAQVYRQSRNAMAKETAFPTHFEGSVFISEMSRGWIKEVRLNPDGSIASINTFMSGFSAPGDMEFGPDGSLYVLEYGSGFFSGSPDTKLVRVDYAANGRAPVAKAAATPSEGGTPLSVTFSSAGSSDPDGGALTYAWDFDRDGTVDSTAANPAHTYSAAGDYSAVLTVTDPTGKTATAQAIVNVGNTRPVVDLKAPVDGGFFSSGDKLRFDVDVTDKEAPVDCAKVTVSEGLGHDAHVHPNLSVTGCEGVMTTAASTDHGPDANTYGVLSAAYADTGGNGGVNGPLEGRDFITLQPKLRQAEHATGRSGVGETGYDDKSGTRPGAGGIITGMGNGNSVSYQPMSLANMNSISVRYSGSPAAGAAIEARAGSATGPVAARIPLDGATSGLYFYKTVTGQVTSRDADQGGRALFFVYTGGGEINFDEIGFAGTGVAADVAPFITSATATPADGAAPLKVDFTATATDPDDDAITYAWDFGVPGTEGDTAAGAAASYTYAAAGSYTARVTATDATGKSSAKTVGVVVRRACATPPTPDAGYELLFNGRDLTGWKQSGPGGFTVEDCALTSFGGLGLLWNDVKQYDDYSLKLQFKLSDDGDNSGVFTRFPDPGDDPFVAVDRGHEIQIKEGAANDEPQKTGSVYNFDREDRRNAKPNGEWNDYEIRVVGQTYVMTLNGVEVNRYTSDGSRGTTGFVGLQNHGTPDTVSFRNVQIKPLVVDEPFVNTVAVSPVRGAAPLEVTFTADGVDRQGDALTYEWDFGDGSAPQIAGAVVEHTYTGEGSFTATVTPIDVDGTRGQPVDATAVVVLTDPVPQASAAPSCGIAPVRVDFTGSATDPQDQSVTYAWDFGDEGDDDTSTQASPTYTYERPGSYTATLTVTDPDDNVGTATVRVRALEGGVCRAVADLTSYFNNDGISTPDSPGDGNFDGGGWTYASETLPEPVRANGGSVVIEGVDYEFPSPADGKLNNVEADGQVIALPGGRFTGLSVLGAAHNGDVQQAATLTYADGTTSTVQLRFTDWAQSPKFGETVAVDMPHRHDAGGNTGPRVFLWAQSVPLQDKEVASITLPVDPKLHIFAISALIPVEEPPCDQRRSDEFDDDELLDNCRWSIRRANPDLYEVGDGALRLQAGPGEYSTASNVITQATAEGEWQATTKLTFDPDEEGQQAGLVVAGAAGSGFAKLMFVRKSTAGNEWIEFLKSSDPNNSFDFSGNWHTGGGDFGGPFLPADFPTTFWLRMASDGTRLTGYYSTDGETFTKVGDDRSLEGINAPRVGVMALRGSASTAPVAEYDYVRFSGEPVPGGRTWVVDAVDTATTNQWVSPDTGTSEVTVQVGDTVEWQFDRATMAHDITSLDSSDDWDPPLREYRDPQGAPVRYTFTKPGTYEYWCSIHGGTMRGTVVVEAAEPNRPPTATPLVDPRTGGAPLYVHFEAKATDPDGDPLTYEWDFGTADDSSDKSTSTHAHFNYTTPGRYTATLKVSDGKGGVYEDDFLITVTGGVKPIVTASANPRSGRAPLNVVFMGGAQDEQGGNITYAWDFGVPGTDADKAATARAQYTYTQPGTYTAVLSATDPEGNTGTASVQIVVGGDPVEPVLGVEATATPTRGVSPLDVAFATTVTEASRTAGEVKPFADGLAAYPELTGEAEMIRGADHTMTSLAVSGLKPNAAHMVHVHEQACSSPANGGPHFRFDETLPYGEGNEIWLPFTSDAAGASPELMKHSELRAGPKAVSIVVHDPDNMAKRIGCVDLEPTGLTYDWDFGDGESGAGEAPKHTYTEAGTHTATVTVTDEATGEKATDSVEIVVEQGGGTDTVAPQTRVVSGPRAVTRSRTAALRFASSEAGETFECSLDGSVYRPCAATVTLRNLRDGVHRMRVRATDAAGNTDATPAAHTWRVDTRGPVVRATAPRGSTRDRTPTVRATVSDPGSQLTRNQLTLRVDGRVVRGVRYDARADRMTWTSGRPLSVGRHTVRLVAVDAAGNRTVMQWRFTLRR